MGTLAVIFNFSLAVYPWPYVLLALLFAGFLLLRPAWQLFRRRETSDAMNLFNKASLFPLAMLAVVLVKVLIG
jgi:4-hydroxybenzoate polyprenyltransferase